MDKLGKLASGIGWVVFARSIEMRKYAMDLKKYRPQIFAAPLMRCSFVHQFCRTMLLALGLVLMTSAQCIASTGWAATNGPTTTDPSFIVPIAWEVASSGQTPGTLECGDSVCVFGVALHAGIGKVGTWCDAGGICVGSAWYRLQSSPSITVANGTTFENAYTKFVNKFGTSGSFVYDFNGVPPKEAWGKLCAGFVYLPDTSTPAISTLVTDSVCGFIPPPDLACTVTLPPTLDLGTVNSGEHSVTGSVTGQVQCNEAVDGISIAAPGSPYTIAGVPLTIAVNGAELGEAPTDIGAKAATTNLEVVATAEGKFQKAGAYQLPVPLVVNFW